MEDFLDFLANEITDDKIEVGFDNRKITYPLQIESINMVDSEFFPQIQFADLIGSSFAYYAKCILLGQKKDDKMANIIANSNLASLMVHPLQPDLSFSHDDYIENENDIHPLDFLAEKTIDKKDRFDETFPR